MKYITVGKMVFRKKVTGGPHRTKPAFQTHTGRHPEAPFVAQTSLN
jgi:hypothetical protein